MAEEKKICMRCKKRKVRVRGANILCVRCLKKVAAEQRKELQDKARQRRGKNGQDPRSAPRHGA